MHRARSLAVLTAAAALTLVGCSSGEESAQTTPSPAASSASPSTPAPETSAPAASEPAAPAVTAKSGYVTYDEYSADKAAYDQGDVVLFFHASWCSTCQRAEKNLEADPASIPNDLTIVKLDYDSSDMKQQYGVTVQHTFVQVDESGAELAKWTGSNTADEIANKLV